MNQAQARGRITLRWTCFDLQYCLKTFPQMCLAVFDAHQGIVRNDQLRLRGNQAEAAMALTRIRMELARTEGYPEGSALHGYEFIAPLTADGHIDAEEWLAHKDKCTVRRFWNGEPEEFGKLRHLGHGWRFDYNPP